MLDFRIARITWPLHERRELFVQNPHSALNLLLLVRAPADGRSLPLTAATAINGSPSVFLSDTIGVCDWPSYRQHSFWSLLVARSFHHACSRNKFRMRHTGRRSNNRRMCPVLDLASASMRPITTSTRRPTDIRLLRHFWPGTGISLNPFLTASRPPRCNALTS